MADDPKQVAVAIAKLKDGKLGMFDGPAIQMIARNILRRLELLELRLLQLENK